MALQRRRQPERRLWDSSAIIAYLAGEAEHADALTGVINEAQHGNIQIMVSILATIEVAYLRGADNEISEATILDFFGRDFVTQISIDARVSAIARRLVRTYRGDQRLKPPDATHFASAVAWSIPVLETTDPDLLKLSGREGDPLIVIRHPLYEGPQQFPNL